MYRPHSMIKLFGSKWSLVNDYPAPIYNTIREPFCGSAQFSLRYWFKNIIINDIDPAIAGIWQWLIQSRPIDIIDIPLTFPIGSNLLSQIPAPAADLVRRWQRTGHNTCWTVSKWNGLPGLWNETVRSRIASDLICIKHWKVTNLSYLDLPDIECTDFVDPPYESLPKSYEYNTINYQQLAEWCRSRKGQVIVCEREGASWLPFKPLRTITNLKRKKCNEVYWTNME